MNTKIYFLIIINILSKNIIMPFEINLKKQITPNTSSSIIIMRTIKRPTKRQTSCMHTRIPKQNIYANDYQIRTGTQHLPTKQLLPESSQMQQLFLPSTI